MISNVSLRLILCGAAALFWELVLIRWMGSSVRLVAYYSNFILISAFFGLGSGALLVRYKFRLWEYIFVILAICVFLGPFVGSFFHLNPASANEYIWLGSPGGIHPQTFEGFLGLNLTFPLPYWIVLGSIFTVNTFLFVGFGQWLGHLFQNFRPLKAYTLEIGGSILGILLFAVVSLFHLPPTAWFLIGFALLLLIIDKSVKQYLIALASSALVLLVCGNFANQFLWSPYYKIHIAPLEQVHDLKQNRLLRSPQPFGYTVTVNNDYHQMILDLAGSRDHAFFSSWRWLYDYPYQQGREEIEGPVLIVGAGAGNDVSAALRNSQSRIDAVEIDPMIIQLGRRYHFEKPYANPRVRVIVDDARSFFDRTDKRYAKVVFGFLDSHTLMSSFSSLRLDNFVYTYESMVRVKELLLPGGKVYITFASNTPWIHDRLIKLLDSVFDYRTVVAFDQKNRYANGVIYMNGRIGVSGARPLKMVEIQNANFDIPTDDWPFLYMKEPGIPGHYVVFIILMVLGAIGSISLLPQGQRKIKLPYFFMGAGFFLIETSNVVSLSLLYGSTWTVNVTVFTGILSLILIGNWICILTARPRYRLMMSLLFINILISYIIRPSSLLGIHSIVLQGVVASFVFLGPIFFSSLIFGHLIKQEKNLTQAYGSNLMGAVIGGASEYFSLVMGIKFLLIVTCLYYLLAFFYLRVHATEGEKIYI